MLKVILPAWACIILLFSLPESAQSGPKTPTVADLPFQSGEKLTYEISWSNVVKAGTAVMEVKEKRRPQGKRIFEIRSEARSSRALSRFYKVLDTIESEIDAESLHTLHYRLDQKHGSRKKKKEMTFDPEKKAMLVQSNGRQESYPVPDDVQDALSAIYYVRSRKELTPGKSIMINVHEDGKTWSVEVQVLAREKIKTIMGDSDTLKLKTYPRYEGVFQNKGEIYIWLTDDNRKIPVLMKSTITIGTIVSTLVEYQSGEQK